VKIADRSWPVLIRVCFGKINKFNQIE
jgi:hypothetical protein